MDNNVGKRILFVMAVMLAFCFYVQSQWGVCAAGKTWGACMVAVAGLLLLLAPTTRGSWVIWVLRSDKEDWVAFPWRFVTAEQAADVAGEIYNMQKRILPDDRFATHIRTSFSDYGYEIMPHPIGSLRRIVHWFFEPRFF